MSVNQADLQFPDFTSDRFFTKLCRNGSTDIVKDCQCYFGTEMPPAAVHLKT